MNCIGFKNNYTCKAPWVWHYNVWHTKILCTKLSPCLCSRVMGIYSQFIALRPPCCSFHLVFSVSETFSFSFYVGMYLKTILVTKWCFCLPSALQDCELYSGERRCRPGGLWHWQRCCSRMDYPSTSAVLQNLHTVDRTLLPCDEDLTILVVPVHVLRFLKI